MVRAFLSLNRAFSSKDKQKEQVEDTVSGETNVSTLFRETAEQQPVVEESGDGRVKTTFLGFEGLDDIDDIEEDDARPVASGPRKDGVNFPTGWLVIVDGPGRGTSFSLSNGVNAIGRGMDQAVCLDFGDNTISRDGHVHIAYDVEDEAFYVGHGGKANLARLNGKPLLSTEEISDRDRIKLGQTELMFIPLCNDEFNWLSDEDVEDDDNEE